MREVIGRTPIQPALTELRAQIETDVLRQTQQILDNYKAGRRDHPGAAAEGRSAGRGDRKLPRRAARQHRRRTPAQRGRGLPQRHRAARPRRCRPHRRGGPGRPAGLHRRGRPARRSASCRVLAAYQAAKDVTLQRMYLETMQDILTHSPSLVVDDKLKGLVPFLPLNLPNPARPSPPARRARRHRPPPPEHRRRPGARR